MYKSNVLVMKMMISEKSEEDNFMRKIKKDQEKSLIDFLFFHVERNFFWPPKGRKMKLIK